MRMRWGKAGNEVKSRSSGRLWELRTQREYVRRRGDWLSWKRIKGGREEKKTRVKRSVGWLNCCEVRTQKESESSVAVCPVRRQCPRFRATGCTRCRAVHDQGPHGYPVSEVQPMTLRSVVVSTDGPFTLSLLAFTVTLSLGRPHGSCGHARPEAPAGIEH